MSICRPVKQRELYTREDEIDEEKKRLQEEVQQKFQGNCVVAHIMTIGFEIVFISKKTP